MEEDAFKKRFLIRSVCLASFLIGFLNLFSVQCLAGEHPVWAQKASSKEIVSLDIRDTSSLGEKSKPYHPIIEKAAKRYAVDPALIKAIIMAESGYDPRAVSSQGAAGLMQLMPKTAESLGVEDAFDPVHNVNAGVKYLRQLLEEFDQDVTLALAAYNAGSGMVKRHQGIPPIQATRRYIKKVFAYYQYFKNETAEKTGNV